jgi:hypothetical protein
MSGIDLSKITRWVHTQPNAGVNGGILSLGDINSFARVTNSRAVFDVITEISHKGKAAVVTVSYTQDEIQRLARILRNEGQNAFDKARVKMGQDKMNVILRKLG